MTHTFNPDHISHLENPIRKMRQPAKKTLKKIGLKEGAVLLDIGAGSGYHAIPASSLVGERGRIIAVDIEPRMIALLKKKALEVKATNIETICASADSLNIENDAADIALLSMILHEVPEKEKALRVAHDALKSGGTIAVIDFKPGTSIFGPPNRIRIDEGAMMKMLETAGFSDTSVEDIGGSLYLAIGKKRNGAQ